MKERLLSLNRSPGPNNAVLDAHDAHPIKVMNIINTITNFATAFFKIIFFPYKVTIRKNLKRHGYLSLGAGLSAPKQIMEVKYGKKDLCS